MSELVFALDLSNYTTNVAVPGAGAAGGLITDEIVQGWQAKGFSEVIVGTQWPDVARHQLEVCQRNGMGLSAYHWLWFDRNYMDELDHSVVAVQGFPLKRLWVDIEDPKTQKGPQELIAISHEVMEGAEVKMAVAHTPVGIYTARWWWPGKTGDYKGLSHYPLWHAEYFQGTEGGPPSRVPGEAEFGAFKPYGGWTRPLVWQYAGSLPVLGAGIDNMDLNVTEDDMVFKLTPDGSQRIEGDGTYISIWNQNVEVLRIGGETPGQLSKNFGGQFYNLAHKAQDDDADPVGAESPAVWSNTLTD